MIAGILLIACGILIAVFPHLLSIVVAMVLIVFGTIIIMIAYDHRRDGGRRNATIIKYIIRH